MLVDLNFPLSDIRNKKLLKDYGKYTYNALIEDNVFFYELYRPSYKLTHAELMTITDKKNAIIGKSISDYLSIRETYRKSFYSVLRFLENVKIADKQTNNYTNIKKENINVNEFTKKDIHVNKKQLICITETYWDNILFFLHVIENIKVRDSIKNATHINEIESPVLLHDSIKKNMRNLKKENISFLEKYIRRWDTSHVFKEFISVDDKLLNNTNKKFSEYASIQDKETNHIYPNFNEHVFTNERFNRRVSFIKNLNDTFHIQELEKKRYKKSIKEDNLTIYDRYVHASNAYIEALRVVDEANDEKWFDSMLESMPNYEEFTDFYVGDYEYEKAVIRLILSSSLTDSNPTLYDVVANVDIDDTDDKGTAKITDTTMPTKIYFNKHYYNAPEVQVTINSGSGNETITPYIVNTEGVDGNKRYFEVELRNNSNERVKGAISWISKGW